MDRREISFAQAEGQEPLPSQLRAKEISPELRAKLWRIMYLVLDNSKTYVGTVGYSVANPWREILHDWHVDRLHGAYDDFNYLFREIVARTKVIFFSESYISVFDLLQFIIRHHKAPAGFARAIDQALEGSRAAYRVIDKTIMPISEPEEVGAVRRDLQTVRGSQFKGAYVHLRAAGEHLSDGDFAAVVRESIHAVESACKQLEPSANTLGPALKALESDGRIHPSLKDAFLKLYGYTSDEEGVRHALVMKDEASVAEAEALFMYSACVAFVGYLSRKAP